MTQVPQTNSVAQAMSAELLSRLTLDLDGQPFDDADPATWARADAVKPEIVSLGATRFKIVDDDAIELAVAADAIEEGATSPICLRVAFEEADDAPVPRIGQYVALATDEPDVTVLFLVWLTYDDLNDPAAPDLGPDATRNEALDVIRPGEALLVQVFDTDESEGSHEVAAFDAGVKGGA